MSKQRDILQTETECSAKGMDGNYLSFALITGREPVNYIKHVVNV